MDNDELLAYETGFHLGDGHLQADKKNKVYRVVYCGDANNDFEFCTEILPNIIQRLYNKVPRIYKRKNENTLIVNLNSKDVVRMKISLGLPVGNKLNLKEVPSWLYDDKLALFFIRGLADADFSLTFKKNKKGLHCEPRIEFFTNNKIIAEFVRAALSHFRFRVAFEHASQRGFEEFRLRMYGKSMLKKWMMLIGFSNPKHLKKFRVFEEFGCYPRPFP